MRCDDETIAKWDEKEMWECQKWMMRLFSQILWGLSWRIIEIS